MDLGSENVFCMLTIVLVSYHYIANDKPCKTHAEHAIPSLTMLRGFLIKTGQNKNQYMLGYLCWRVMTGRHEEIEYSMQIPGHTR